MDRSKCTACKSRHFHDREKWNDPIAEVGYERLCKDCLEERKVCCLGCDKGLGYTLPEDTYGVGRPGYFIRLVCIECTDKTPL